MLRLEVPSVVLEGIILRMLHQESHFNGRPQTGLPKPMYQMRWASSQIFNAAAGLLPFYPQMASYTLPELLTHSMASPLERQQLTSSNWSISHKAHLPSINSLLADGTCWLSRMTERSSHGIVSIAKGSRSSRSKAETLEASQHGSLLVGTRAQHTYQKIGIVYWTSFAK